MAPGRKFLWAVDPFAEEHSTQLLAYWTLETMAAAVGARIEPVAVLSPEHLRVPASAFEGMSRDYRLEAEKRMESWFEKIRTERLDAPRLLVQTKLSLSSTVDAFLKFARESHAELIAIGTTTRKPLERFFIGSFAETMMLRSEIPLLVVNPEVPAAGKLKRILFPTDLSEASRSAFDVLLPEAKALGAEVVVYSKAEYGIPPENLPGTGIVFSYVNHLKSDVEQRRKDCVPWIEAATRAGVTARLLVDERTWTASSAILETAKEQAVDLIALSSRSGPVESVVLGSVARQVIRHSPLPVWVIHPRNR